MAIPANMPNFAVDMLRLPNFINRNLSIRLSLIVVLSMAMLLLSSLLVMLFYARKALKEEALEKAAQTLEATVQRIDNILLSVEQAAGNVYFRLLPQLNSKEKMITYSRQLVESNPYIMGCAIAFEPGYYKEGESFMAYFRCEPASNSQGEEKIVRCEQFGDSHYTEQEWFTVPMATSQPGWMKPLSDLAYYDLAEEDRETMAVTTFCLPILGNGRDSKPVAVLGVDVSLSLLSRIILSVKPSDNSYCTLLDKDGSFIVHPDSNKLFQQTVFTQLEHGADPSVETAAKAMVSGETGYLPFRLNGTDYYVFYKPFLRSAVPGRTLSNQSWSVGIIYPKDDIFGDHNSLRYYMLAIAIVGLLLLFLLCRDIIHRQLLPLRMLTKSAQHIANGHYDEIIPESRHKDEIGRLQNNFQQMQQSLASYIGELEQLTTTLKERGEGLRVALNQAQKADRMKTAFLHNMTNQMAEPAEAICKDVEEMMHPAAKQEEGAATKLADDILQKGDTIAKLLDNLINLSDEDKTQRPEASSTKKKGGRL